MSAPVLEKFVTDNNSVQWTHSVSEAMKECLSPQKYPLSWSLSLIQDVGLTSQADVKPTRAKV